MNTQLDTPQLAVVRSVLGAIEDLAPIAPDFDGNIRQDRVPRRGKGLLVVSLILGLLLIAGTAIAATIGLSRSDILQSEGSALQEGSEREVRSITIDDATWTVVRYSTADGYTCLDSDLTVGGTFYGSIGGCQPESADDVIGAGVGSVWDGEALRVLLTGTAAPTVARVAVTDDLGRVLDDLPVDEVWAVIPLSGSSSWIVEAFDADGNPVARVGIDFED
jgi:hypothetical protein